jgi:hypothetical protein
MFILKTVSIVPVPLMHNMLRREEFPYLNGTIYIMKSTIDNNNNAWILLGKLQIKKCPMHVAGWHWRPPSVSLDDATRVVL